MPPAHDGGQSQPRRLQVVLFSGGRGSGALTRELIASPAIDLTVAINGYDDGASTGEVRRFLGDSLGPSDFRKNASAIAGKPVRLRVVMRDADIYSIRTAKADEKLQANAK